MKVNNKNEPYSYFFLIGSSLLQTTLAKDEILTVTCVTWKCLEPFR